MSRDIVLKRVRELLKEDGISCAGFCDATGFSEDQFYYWTGAGNKCGLPSLLQTRQIYWAFDWSPTYAAYGIGPKRLSDVAKLTDESRNQALILAKLEELLLK